MTTRGRTGLPHWLLGSVAEQVLHSADVPVLLFRPHDEAPATRFDRIIVPLDRSLVAEQALPYAERLARALRLPITPLHVHRHLITSFVDPVSSVDVATYEEM